jgi:membrane fusion protein, heavy metal efflux system
VIRRGWAVAVVATVLAIAGGVRWAASGAHPARAGAPPGRDVPRLEGAFIRYSPDFAVRAGISVATASEAEISPVMTVTGTATFDPQLTAAVGARIAGRVRSIERYEGAEVRAGDVLAEIESVELAQAQAALVSARAHAAEASANEDRETQLAAARVSSAREAEQARAAAASARAELVATEQRVRALGGAPNGELGVLTLRSPIAGKVVEAHVSRGQSVEPQLTAFRIADLRRLWVELAVFERDLGSIRAGDAVEISPQTDARTMLTGAVAHVGDVIDLDTRSADVRIVVDNRDGSLRPGQSVLARIARAPDGGDGGVRRLVVPRAAVVSVDGRPTVFVSHDATSVEVRSVTLGAHDAAVVEIVAGLKPRERLVVDGVFALKSELFR